MSGRSKYESATGSDGILGAVTDTDEPVDDNDDGDPFGELLDATRDALRDDYDFWQYWDDCL